MGYLHIYNLYKNQDILLFKECYALEKIHGTSAHISWKDEQLHFFSGGSNHESFINLFNHDFLIEKFKEIAAVSMIFYGEAYGGKLQGMSRTYGNHLKFVVFDVKINNIWLDVPMAENLSNNISLDFISYEKITTDIDSLNFARDKNSVQAFRNGLGSDKKMEGVVLRPLIELTKNNGERIIAKHKRDDFKETKTERELNPVKLKILNDAQKIAEEWVTEMRLNHILDKLPKDINMESIPIVISAMQSDILREAVGEIVPSKEALKAIGRSTANLFKNRIKNRLSCFK